MAEFRPQHPEELLKIPAGHRFVVFDGELAPTSAMLSDISSNPQIRGILFSKAHASNLPTGFQQKLRRSDLFVRELPDAAGTKQLLESKFSGYRALAASVGGEGSGKLESAIKKFGERAGHAEVELLHVALAAFEKIPRESVFGSALGDEERLARATYAIDFLSKVDLRKVVERATKPDHEGKVAPSAFSISHRTGGGEADFFPGYVRLRHVYADNDFGYMTFNFNDPERLHVLWLDLDKRLKTEAHVKAKDRLTNWIGWRNLNLNTALVLAEAIGVKRLSIEMADWSDEATADLVRELEVFHDLSGIHPWRPVYEKEGGKLLRYERSVSGTSILSKFGREQVLPKRFQRRLKRSV